MKKLIYPLSIILSSVLSLSCSKEDDNIAITPKESTATTTEEDFEVENFIYAGMNEIYLYKAYVPQLTDSYYNSNKKEEYIKTFDSPEELYEGLQAGFDEFSFMTSDYEALAKSFQGVSKVNGMSFGLGRIGDTDDLFGYVQYVLPGTSAEEQGVERGDIFTEINGISLNISNYRDLLSDETYTIDINRIENGYITPTGNTIALISREYSENPIYISTVIEEDGKRIGYLMYNGFTGTDAFDSQLNGVFAEFKSLGISDLILDLRYNGGGSVETAVDLAGMITGQYKGEVFIKEKWNDKYQNAWPEESYITRFDSEIRTGEVTNSLNLNKIYVIGTGSTASASELIINGLEPYIDVIHIGTTTRGKFQASTTLYDAPNFYLYDSNGNLHVNPEHKYAIQPLIFKSANANGKTDFVDGLSPDIEIRESLSNFGELGNPDESLLRTAINAVLGKPQENVSAVAKRAEEKFRVFGEGDMIKPTYQRMYIDKLPGEVLNLK